MFEVTSRLNHACSPSVEWVAYADIPSLDSVRLMVLQCVAVCVAVCCSVLQCVAESGWPTPTFVH